MSKLLYVYILTNKRYGTMYTGMTSNLPKRIWEHKSQVIDGFTKDNNLKTLVYYEHNEKAESAIKREKRLKKWERQWKIELIEKGNPNWYDLYENIVK